MLELYKLHWSHYVEKVRWALDYKRLPWRGIDIVAFTKKEMRRFEGARTVPLLHDPATGAAIGDSSPIIRYLEETYPERPLFPADPAGREAVWQWMLRLDSTLGLYARRLGYTQLIMECPQTLAQLFMPQVWGGLFARRGWRRLAAPVLGMMLTLRFRFHRNRHDRIYERLETLLLPLAERMATERWLVGGQFTAADLTLASLLRPLRIVPHFSHHPRLLSLFAWQERLFREHGRDATFPYEDAIRAQRLRRGWMRGQVRWLRERRGEADLPPAASLEVASNDIHPISPWTLLTGLPAYLRLRWFQGIDWMPYVPEPHLSA
ncbi:glutathione S-transferase family protein [Dyella sp. BiH032]|uniref:glutathione S-transferase family protein n=1 Tax=Dyella sp. BiH032 TaxID=3075430 RepID=UPI00289335D1|nr:glutathione S-transferase family protein [Dyella sp. BiH032]WNL45805.1 glutathione S-transferase family protein [Dyella sp. BiH032]